MTVVLGCVVAQFPDAPPGPPAQVEMPARWNGTLLLFSHGYVVPGSQPLASDAPTPSTHDWLLAHGYALAGASFRNSGWAVEEALDDQVRLLDSFRRRYGAPRRTIAWGASMGGLITAALVERNPASFAAGFSICGVMAGAVASWNLRLDSAFAFRALLAPGSRLGLVRVADPAAELAAARQLARKAEGSAAGQARLALVAALGDLPRWPAGTDDFYVLRRAELEGRAGGNPSWNLGVDYRLQLMRSRYRAEVVRKYADSGLDLESDLDRLVRAPRIAADSRAVAYLSRNTVLTGRLQVPFLTLHATGDDQVPVEHERAYGQAAAAAGSVGLLRQLFVDRSGHCGVRPPEMLAALRALIERVDRGAWPSLRPADLNRGEAGPEGLPAFTSYQPGPFLRPEPTPALAGG